MNAIPAPRIPHRVGRRTLRRLVERRGPRLDLGMPKQSPERSRPLAVQALDALNA